MLYEWFTGFIAGLAVCVIFIVVGIATNWFGLPQLAADVVAWAGGLLSTLVIGPALAKAARR